MRVSGRAVIIEDGKVYTIFRRKVTDGVAKEYYVLPGGGQEEGESLEETVIRELKEEFDVDIEILGYLGSNEYKDTVGYYFHCKITNGTPTISGEELDRMTEENLYEVRLLDLDKLDDLDAPMRELISKAVNKEYTTLV